MSAGGGGVVAGRAFVVVGADLAPLKAAFAGLNRGITEAAGGLRNLSAGFLKLGAVVSAPFLIAGRSGTEFIDKINQVRAITGATGEDFERLSNKAKELGASTSFTAAQVAEGLRFLGQAGFSTEESLSGIEGTLTLARAGFLDLGSASDIAASAVRAFGLNASEVNDVADVLAATASNANTDVTQLGEAMKFAAPLGAAAGSNIREVSAALGVLGDSGLKGTLAGTNLAIIFRQLADTNVQKKLEEIGIKALDSTGNLRPLSAVISELGEATDDLPNAARIALFNELFQARGAKGALNLAKMRDRLKELEGTLDGAAGRAKEMSDVMDDNLAGALRLTNSAFEGLQIAITEAIEKPVQEALGVIQLLLQEMIAWVEANGEIVRTVLLVGAGLLAMGVAIGAAALALTALGGILSAIGTVFAVATALVSALAAVIGFLVSPIGIAIGALAGLTVAFFTMTEMGKRAVEIVSQAFSSLAGRVTQTVQGIVDALLAGNLQAAGEVVMAALNLAWQNGVSSLTQTWNGFVSTLGDAFTSIRVLWNDLVSGLASIWTNFVSGIRSIWEKVVDFLAGTIIKVAAVFDDSIDADAILADLEKIAQKNQSEIETDRQNRQNAIQEEGEERRNELLKANEEAKSAREAETQAAKERLKAARERLDAATEAAAQARAQEGSAEATTENQAEGFANAIQEALGGVQTPMMAENVSSVGFSGSAVAAEILGGQLQQMGEEEDKVAEEVKKGNEELKAIREAVENPPPNTATFG